MKLMRTDRLGQRIQKNAAIFMAAALEYIATELWDSAGTIAQEAGKKRIIPRHIKLAISQDEELSKILAGSVIHEGGVRPHIE